MSLVPDEIRLWYAWPRRFEQASRRETCWTLLSDDERARAQRFRFERDRQIYVVAHALVRDVLARATGQRPEELRFEAGEHGKPELVTAGSLPGLRFNLSHTHGLVAVAAGLEHDLGVDVEHRARENDLEQIARGVFSPVELAGMMALEGEARRRRFFELWTLKEAYVKAIGKGLSAPLKRFTLEPGLRPPTIAFADVELGDAAQWQFALSDVGPDHQLAVSVRSATAVLAAPDEWPGASPV